MGSEEKKAKKEKREARSPEDAAAREARKAAKRAKKEGEKKGGGGGESGADGAVARVRVSPVPPGSDAATIAAFLGVDASEVVVLSGEATAIMLDAAAAANAASTLDETKFKGRFVRVVRDDFRPDAVAADASGDDEVRDRADRAKPPPRRLEITHDVHDDVVRWSALARRPHHREGRVEDPRDRGAHRVRVARAPGGGRLRSQRARR